MYFVPDELEGVNVKRYLSYGQVTFDIMVSITSGRRTGNLHVIFGGHKFNRHSSSNALRTRWICSRFRSGCRATIVMWENVIVKILNHHNH
ncbi:hypothetical protein EVAR_17939_1 [Eumeta japonica]|uniref:FLYWCH-type domain-containing protein n=1 Tax=Eumeta variegata TaxID=151549 RepID=A0A4C1UYX3_EUMVA|nr:hypothetical protein EVAR_17939_1 [Eumeta japonica]